MTNMIAVALMYMCICVFISSILQYFPGNKDQNTAVTNKLDVPFVAQYIRLVPRKFINYPSMRWALNGCPPPSKFNIKDMVLTSAIYFYCWTSIYNVDVHGKARSWLYSMLDRQIRVIKAKYTYHFGGWPVYFARSSLSVCWCTERPTIASEVTV